LQIEIDKSKTSMREGMDVVAALATAGKPLVRYAERLLRAYAGASANSQRSTLPAPLAVKRITGPPPDTTEKLRPEAAEN
jgi:hypothetical protein